MTTYQLTVNGERKEVAVDPGTRSSGMAFFEDGTLIRTELIAEDAKTAIRPRASNMVRRICARIAEDASLVVEMPRFYPRSKTDPEDLLWVVYVDAGVLEGSTYKDARILRPAEWKRQLPKTKKIGDYLVRKRASNILSREEAKIVFADESFDGRVGH